MPNHIHKMLVFSKSILFLMLKADDMGLATNSFHSNIYFYSPNIHVSLQDALFHHVGFKHEGGWRVQYWCVCYHKLLLSSISKQAAALKPSNLRHTMVLYEIGKFFQGSMACAVCEFENKKTNCTDII